MQTTKRSWRATYAEQIVCARYSKIAKYTPIRNLNLCNAYTALHDLHDLDRSDCGLFWALRRDVGIRVGALKGLWRFGRGNWHRLHSVWRPLPGIGILIDLGQLLLVLRHAWHAFGPGATLCLQFFYLHFLFLGLGFPVFHLLSNLVDCTHVHGIEGIHGISYVLPCGVLLGICTDSPAARVDDASPKMCNNTSMHFSEKILGIRKKPNRVSR